MQAQLVINNGSSRCNPTFKWVAECLYRHSKSGAYYALVKRNGKQFRKSLKTSDRQLAQRSLVSFRVNVGRIANPTKDRGITFSELAQDWFDAAKTRMKPSSVRCKEVCFRQLNKHFGSLPVRKITTTTCNEWEKVRGSGISASTFNHDLTALLAVLNYGVREGLIMENPALTIKRRKLPKNKITIPTKEDFTRLVTTMRSLGRRAWKGADLVELLAYSGMRLSEATALTWCEIDFERGQFTVTGGAKGTKNHEARTVPLFPALRSLLEHMLEHIKAKRKKTKRKGGFSTSQRVVPIVTAQRAIATACKKAELAHFHHHLCRHFFVSQAIEAGVDFKTIAAWVGHKDGGMLVAKTYGHLRDTHSAEMAKRMTFSASGLGQ